MPYIAFKKHKHLFKFRRKLIIDEKGMLRRLRIPGPSLFFFFIHRDILISAPSQSDVPKGHFTFPASPAGEQTQALAIGNNKY